MLHCGFGFQSGIFREIGISMKHLKDGKTESEELELDPEVRVDTATADPDMTRFVTIAHVGGQKRLKIFGVEFVYLYFLGICMAMLGWILENVGRLVTYGVIDSRFHILPFISPYALIVFAFHLVLGNPDSITFFGHKMFKKDTLRTAVLSNLLTVVLFCFLTFFGELAIGNLWDKCFGVQLWDYSNQPLHVTPYAGLIPTLLYGVGCYVIFKLLYMPSLKAVRKHMPFNVARIICYTLGILIVLDTIRMMICIMAFGEAPMIWSISFR